MSRSVEEQAAKILANEALANKRNAEAARANVETRIIEYKAEADKLHLEVIKDEEADRRASDSFHLIYRFSDSVGDQSVGNCMKKLTQWHRRYPGEAIEVIFNSPGGSITPGFELFDFLVDLGEQGHKVTTGCTGMAASMAGILVQAGTHRWMSKESWYMIHQAAFGAMGKTFEIEDEVAWVKRIQERILKIFAARSDLTIATLKRNWQRKDWWIDSDEALKFGLVDEVRASGLPKSEDTPE